MWNQQKLTQCNTSTATQARYSTRRLFLWLQNDNDLASEVKRDSTQEETACFQGIYQMLSDLSPKLWCRGSYQLNSNNGFFTTKIQLLYVVIQIQILSSDVTLIRVFYLIGQKFLVCKPWTALNYVHLW